VSVSSAHLRGRLGLTRQEWSRALGVTERTVMRWENQGTDPGGLASEVMRGIENALAEGADPGRVARLVSLGIGALLFTELMRQIQGTAPTGH